MAHRQLSSLARGICRPRVYIAVHHRAIQQPPEFHHRTAVDFCLNKLGSRFFSKSSSHRKTAGQITNVSHDNMGSQGHSIASQARENQFKSSDSSQALEDQSKSQGSSDKSSSNYVLILGAGTVLVISLFAFFPWDLIKSYYPGEKKDVDLSLEDLKERSSKGAISSIKAKQGAEEEKIVLEDLKHLPLVHDQEHENVDFKPTNETSTEETSNTHTTELLKNYPEGAGHPNLTESVAFDISSSSSLLDDNISAVKSEQQKMSEAEPKDVNTKNHLFREDLSPISLSDNTKDKQNLATSKSSDELFVPISPTSEFYVSSKDSISMQTPSRSPIRRPNLLEAYYLGEVSNPSLQYDKEMIEHRENLTDKDQLENSRHEESMNKLHIDGVQNMLDLLDVVHAAEKRQAELDAQLYKEAQKRLTHAFQQELKTAQAKEMMYAEEASRLVKEIEIERERAAATLESEQSKAREKLSKELKHKEEEANLMLKKAELLSETEVAAALAREKLSYINDVRNVKQELEALYMVLFTQSEDFRQSHSIHKLAVGTFALVDAMKRGAPLEKEVTLICSAYKDGGLDPLLEAIISSLPEQAVKKGTLTPYQLQEKFKNLKKGVLELSLIPATGGGFISHAAAKIVSAFKVKESGQFSDGVAAVVGQVQRYLADGKLVDAAELLEKGVHGTKAQFLVADWIQNVRERATVEQVLLLLQAHTTATASSLAQ